MAQKLWYVILEAQVEMGVHFMLQEDATLVHIDGPLRSEESGCH